MIAAHYGRRYSLDYLRQISFIGHDGVSLLGISDAAEQLGLRSLAVMIPVEKLNEVLLPCIAHWRQKHFVVVYRLAGNLVYVADPAHGLLTYSREEFNEGWCGLQRDAGVLLLLEPTPHFYKNKTRQQNGNGFRFLISYLMVHRKSLALLFLLMLVGSLLLMALPFLTQAVIDRGVQQKNVNILYLILLAQLALYAGVTVATFVRGRILLYIGTRINIAIISDFLVKLMKLPIAFYSSKTTGDLLQRINDHYRIEGFLTTTTLTILFAFIQLVAFGAVLAVYHLPVFLVFLAGTIIYAVWLLFFMEMRRDLDYKRFNQLSENQNTLIQLIRGMQEIKLNGNEQQKRWEWQQIQEQLFHISVHSLKIDQYQQGGATLINETKNIIISLLAATAVINGNMTLGMMVAIQYIIGALNSPIGEILSFVRTAQDARISLERLGEIHNREEENRGDGNTTAVPADADLHLHDLSFQYEGPHSEHVLRDLSLHIPAGKVTAIVGPSGSGKTTLLKLLLKFYEPTQGTIHLGAYNLSQLEHRAWRQQCGVVMQDGYIFSDTIARNIALSDEEIDYNKLGPAARVAHIHDFIVSLPLGYDTRIGAEGHGLSQGQKQRILIARAVYKNPNYLFFDEATNALDANNERVIMHHLNAFYHGRTVVVVAHRLSTVQQADQIVVLDKGCIVERGTHAQLTAGRGVYYHLVKNQLELGS